jgi:geranylgeranyl pyrophosphate synthase
MPSTSPKFPDTYQDYLQKALPAMFTTRVEGLGLPPRLQEAVLYAVLGEGKRVRPMLVLGCCDAVGGSVDDSMFGAMAVESIHAFSLVHDDLPGMDDDDLRRGRPTVHRAFDEATAILCGDLIMNMAFEICMDLPRSSREICLQLLKANRLMIAGQSLDMNEPMPDGLSELEQLKLIHSCKTGALILGSCRIGAILGGANPEQMELIDRYGEAIGLMFQVVDDVLDETQTTDHLGKAAAKDRDMGKLTYPSVIGLEASLQEVRDLEKQALELVAPLGEAAEPLAALARYLAIRTR